MNYFFDLDGTLTDPGVGISRCIRHALEGLGSECPSEAELLTCVGPPLQRTFARLLSTDDAAVIGKAVGLYRERFVKQGIFENRLYPESVRGLERLTARDHRLWVVTSKPHVYASKILAHFGIDRFFEGVYGSELDGSNTEKVDLVRLALAAEDVDPAETWMIGDRAEDIKGGRANGTRTAAALWGYGTEAELRREEPDILVRSIGQVPIS